MSVFDDVFDDNYPSQILVDDVFDAEHNAGLFDEISILHQAIMDQNWPEADAQIERIESLMNEQLQFSHKELIMNPAYNVGRAHARIHSENMSKIKAMVFVPDDREKYPNWSIAKAAGWSIVVVLGGQIAFGLLSYWGI